MPHRVTGEVLGFGQLGRDRREGKILGWTLCWGFLGEKAGQGRVSSLDLASLNTFGGF